MSRSPLTRVGLTAAYVGYLAVLAVLTLDPSQQAPGASLSLVSQVLTWLRVPVPADSRILEVASNVVLFVPLSLIGGLLWPARRVRDWVLVGALLSTLIEVCQLLFLPDRFATVSDVLANTTGALLGALLWRRDRPT